MIFPMGQISKMGGRARRGGLFDPGYKSHLFVFWLRVSHRNRKKMVYGLEFSPWRSIPNLKKTKKKLGLRLNPDLKPKFLGFSNYFRLLSLEKIIPRIFDFFLNKFFLFSCLKYVVVKKLSILKKGIVFFLIKKTLYSN